MCLLEGKPSIVFAEMALSATGAGLRLHVVPFQCSMRAGALPPTSPHALHPATQISVGEIALMLFSTADGPTFGLATIFHVAPSQCSMTVLRPSCIPAAHTLLAARPETASRAPFGAETRLHCTPLKCMVSAPGVWPETAPTAHISVGEMTVISVSSPAVMRGTDTTLHAVPLKCKMRGVPLLRLSKDTPNAKMLLAVTAFTEFNLSPFAKCGLATTLQAVPLKCWI